MPTPETTGAARKLLYAVIDSADEDAIRAEGILGEALYNIPYRDIGAVVGDAAAQPDRTACDKIMKFEEVVEGLMERWTVLPARFSTGFESKDKVAAALEQNYARLKDNLDSVRGKLEFGVKALWDADKLFLPVAAEASAAPAAAVSGKNYMYARATEYRRENAFKEKADGYIRAVNSVLMEAAAEKNLEKPGGGRLFFNAAYLVEIERTAAFKGAFEQLRASFPELSFLISGPWPPYNFVRGFQ